MMANKRAVNKTKMKVNIVLIAPSTLVMFTSSMRMCLHHGAKNTLGLASTAMSASTKRQTIALKMMKWSTFQGQFLAKSVAQGMMMMMSANHNTIMNVAIDVKNLTLLLAMDVKAESTSTMSAFVKNILRPLQGKRTSITFVTKLVNNVMVTMTRTIPIIVTMMRACITHAIQEMEEDHLLKVIDRHLTPMVDTK